MGSITVVIDNYSHYPEVSIVPDTKFSTLNLLLRKSRVGGDTRRKSLMMEDIPIILINGKGIWRI